jgi:type 1 fimbria pilin
MKKMELYSPAKSALISPVLYGLLSLLFSGSAHAASDRLCVPDDGASQIQYNVTDAFNSSENEAGNIVIYRTQQDSGGRRTFTCTCSNTNASVLHYFSAQSPFSYYAADNLQWLKVNPSFSTAVEIYVYNSTGGSVQNNYHSVPFTGVTNNVSADCNTTGSASTATKGKVSVKLEKRVVGTLAFNGTVARVWHYRRPNYVNPSDPVSAIVNLKIDVEVPANCALRAGSVLTVPFGTLQSSQFNGVTYPNPPNNFTPKPVDLAFDCDFSSEILSLQLNADQDAPGQGIKVQGRTDLSVIITDEDGTVLPPNQKAGEVVVDSDMKTSTLHLKAHPSNPSATLPTPGEFTATAVIQLDIK